MIGSADLRLDFITSDENEAMQPRRKSTVDCPHVRIVNHQRATSHCRCGELCGLKWADGDLKNSIIHVRRSSQYLSGRGVYDKNPKTAGSTRSGKVIVISWCHNSATNHQESIP